MPPTRFNPYLRVASTRSAYTGAAPTSLVPMQISQNYPSRNGRTYRSSGSSSYRRSRNRGPYGVLTMGRFHTNNTYPKPEVKFNDVDATAGAYAGPNIQPITAAGSIVCLNRLAQGLTASNRIGTMVSTKSCAYRYELDLPTATANQVPTSGRVLLIWDKQANNAVPSFTDIFTVASYLSFMNPGNVERFTILRNQQFSLSPNGDQVLFFEGFVKINMPSTWPSTTTAAATPLTGALLLVFIGDQATAANQPTISGCWRTRYMDN